MLLSCDLLLGEINRLVVFQANHILREYLSTVLEEIDQPETTTEADLIERPPCRESVHFEDDLKRGEFNIITENKGL